MTTSTWTVAETGEWFVVPAPATHPSPVIEEWRGTAIAVLEEKLAALPDAVVPDGVPEPGPEAEAWLRQAVEQSVAELLAVAEEATTDGARVLATPSILDRAFLPVLVTVGTSSVDDPEDLLATLGATGGAPVSPPAVDYLDLPEGDGARVVRSDIDADHGAVWVTVAVGRRVEDGDRAIDTVLLFRTRDVVTVPDMIEALDRLLAAVEVATARSEP